jgi:hypothetical protein
MIFNFVVVLYCIVLYCIGWHIGIRSRNNFITEFFSSTSHPHLKAGCYWQGRGRVLLGLEFVL